MGLNENVTLGRERGTEGNGTRGFLVVLSQIDQADPPGTLLVIGTGLPV